ncbi:unnamed protein product [marine sediment metagenome]|uniref:Uncharacterized protein n=1 Tax=marine sediment metagenome TaxID=412755 RepID=X0W057_9ZZZZ
MNKIQIINKLQPYVNGKLITDVFVNYWNELVELIESEMSSL